MTLFARKVPFVPQMEATECGAASLAMVLAYFGCHVPLAELRRECAVSRDGASALDVVKAARTYGLAPKALKIARVDGLEGLVLPAILHWDLNHFVVLERIDRDRAVLVDPAVGRRHVTRAEVDRAFSGVVVTFARGPAFQRRKRTFRGAATYRRLLAGAWRGLLAGGACALLLEALGLLVPAASGFVVDVVVRPHQDRWLAVLGVALAVALLLRVLLQVGRERVVSGVEARLQVELATELVRHLLALPTSFHTQRGSGDLLARTSALLDAREAFARLLSSAFDLVLVLAYGALMVLYDVRLGAACVLVELVVALASMLARRRAKPAAAARQIAAGRAHAAVVQAFAEPETAKAFGAEEALLARYTAARTSELNVGAEISTAVEPAQHALSLASAASTAVVLALGGHAVLADRMTVGTLTAFLALQALLARPLGRVVDAVQAFAELGPVLDRVDDVLETAPEKSGKYLPGAGIRGEIVFENVSFRHGTKGPLLLDDVSFRISPGERVAIVGASGSGKSTILRLVLGLLTPTSGRVLVDGRPVAEHDAGALRAATGAVLGSGAFFDGTVFDNVALGAPDVAAKDVRDALEVACAAEVVDALPEGLLTRLGPGATRVSGGQRQRLLLARALAKQPELLLLDEASSALDDALEARVHANLSRTTCTTLLVAHRPAAVASADRVLVLAGGKITRRTSSAALVAPEVQLVRRGA